MDKIEKLQQLVNEHRIECTDVQRPFEFPMSMKNWRLLFTMEYGFIQWLVKNGHLDLSKLMGDTNRDYGKFPLIKSQERWYGYEIQDEVEYPIDTSLIMLLAIQKDPVYFLLDLLK